MRRGRGVKYCKRCEQAGRNPNHSEEDFHTDNSRSDGLSIYCWECRAEAFERRYYSDEAFRERVRERARERRRQMRSAR
jgi:hypothetical protein